MNFLHHDFYLDTSDVVEVTLDKQANVRLLDDANYLNYKSGRQHTYYGGLTKVSPHRIPAPCPGHWHLVVDLGGFAGAVTASVKILKGQT